MSLRTCQNKAHDYTNIGLIDTNSCVVSRSSCAVASSCIFHCSPWSLQLSSSSPRVRMEAFTLSLSSSIWSWDWKVATHKHTHTQTQKKLHNTSREWVYDTEPHTPKTDFSFISSCSAQGNRRTEIPFSCYAFISVSSTPGKIIKKKKTQNPPLLHKK